MLQPTDMLVFDALKRAAENGDRCPTADDLLAVIGFNSVNSTVKATKRLESAGLIHVERYQRERRVTIVETGHKTAAVRTPAPHWRTRPQHIMTPSLDNLRTRNFDLTREIMKAARAEGKDLAWFLGDLVFEAMRARAIQSEAGEA